VVGTDQRLANRGGYLLRPDGNHRQFGLKCMRRSVWPGLNERIVFLVVVIDRRSQSLGISLRDSSHNKWYESGPVGFVRGILR